MDLDVSRAIKEGVERTISKHGLILVMTFVVVSVIGNIGFDSATIVLYDMLLEMGEEPLTPIPEDGVPFAMALPGSAIMLLILLWVVGWIATSVITMRVMTTSVDEPATSDTIVDRLTVATMNELLARIVIFVAIGIGLVVFVIPGVFFAICFYFARPLIAVDDRNFIDAMSESWAMSKGNRFEIFILLIGAGVLYIMIILPGFVAAALFGTMPVAAAIIYLLVSAVATVFWLSVMARAYVQAVAPTETEEEVEDDDLTELRREAEEWNDPPSVDWK